MEKKLLTQLGNFLIYEEVPEKRENAVPRIRIKDVSASWSASVSFEQYQVYTMIKTIATGEDKGMKDYLEAWIGIMYRSVLLVPDLEFMQKYIDNVNEMIDRTVRRAGEHTEKEDDDALEDVKDYETAAEISQEIAKEEEKEGDNPG